jgi:hypothetical protein
VILSLVAAHCNPVLLYGLEAMFLNKSDISSLSYPYNSVFMKIFSTFQLNVVTLCQFYSDYLPLNYYVDLRTITFYTKLRKINENQANILYNWFGKHEFDSIAAKYNILTVDPPSDYKLIIKRCFKQHATTLISL